MKQLVNLGQCSLTLLVLPSSYLTWQCASHSQSTWNHADILNFDTLSHIYTSTLSTQCYVPLFKPAAYYPPDPPLWWSTDHNQGEFPTRVTGHVKGMWTPHLGVTRRDWGPPSSQTTPCPKWASGARLHLPTYCIPPQCVKPAAVAILCSCFGDKAILNRSANTWHPTRFKSRPPSLIANKLLIGRPFIDLSLWIKEVKVGIKPQCFSLAKRRKKWLKARYSSWVCCQSQPRGSTAEKMMKQVALKRLTDLCKAFTSSCMLSKCCCQDSLPPQPLWSMLLVPRWKTITLKATHTNVTC